MVVGRMGRAIAFYLLPSRCVQNRSVRSLAVMKRCEVHVVAGAFGDFPQQNTVNPAQQRSVQLPGTVEAHTVGVEIGNKNILHLEVPARMQERKRVEEALERAGA